MTIRIFVGCSANGEDAEAAAMLEYTLRHYATQPLELHWMTLSRDPASSWYSEPKKNAGWNTRGWATPFSAFRWAIPHVCEFKGRAIYMDVDMVARDDIAKLWLQTMPDDKAILAKDEKHSCVMLFDNKKMQRHVPSFEALRRTELLYRKVRDVQPKLAARFSGNWNCLDGETYKTLADPDIKVIHFTKVETQPHLKWALPRLHAAGQKHWNRQTNPVPHARKDVELLVDRIWKEAQQAGYKVQNYIPAQPFGQYDEVRGGAPRGIMGFGDEIIGTGLARGAHARGKKTAFGDGRKIFWGPFAKEIFENNPNIAAPGMERQGNLEWVEHYKGARKYNRFVNGKWVWNTSFKPVPGEFFFDDIECGIAKSFAPGFIVIEPNVPWQKTVAPNKDWGESKYKELARRLLLQGHRLVQFRHKNSRRLIEGADLIELQRFRHVVAALSKAMLYIGPEGGMHHAAAAVGVKAVVIYGGFIPPQATGYDSHINLTGGVAACGHIEPCRHCHQAMANISVDQVKDAAIRQLDNEMRNRRIAV